MEEADAVTLIRRAVPGPGRWADLGAGTGTFTRALASLLGADGHITAVEPNTSSRRELERLANIGGARSATIAARSGDFTKPLGLTSLSGILMANSLHFAPYAAQAAVLAQLGGYLGAGGRIVVVEYDTERGNQWVPYPVSMKKFVALCSAAGFTEPSVAGTTPSAFGGTLYAAWTMLA